MDRFYWQLISLVTHWQVAASICYYTIFAATPYFRDTFELSRFEIELIVTSLTSGYAVFLLPLGAAVDQYAEYRALLLGLLGLATGVLLVAVAPSYVDLLAAVFILGFTHGLAML